MKGLEIYALTIADVDKITKLLEAYLTKDHLTIASPCAGLLLSPFKKEETNKKIGKGDIVKQGEVLAIIGDMQGLKVNVEVNELVVNSLQVGQKVKITGMAFPERTLTGYLSLISRQGVLSNSGSPIFEVTVTIPTFTKEERQFIHVGMSATVAIDTNASHTGAIFIPIAAVKEDHGNTYVSLWDHKKMTSLKVKTGKTTMDSVMIVAGLKTGDKILVPYAN